MTPPVLLTAATRIFAAASAGPSNGAMFPVESNAQPMVIGAPACCLARRSRGDRECCGGDNNEHDQACPRESIHAVSSLDAAHAATLRSLQQRSKLSRLGRSATLAVSILTCEIENLGAPWTSRTARRVILSRV